MIKLFVAAKGFIEYKGKILIVRESPKYLDGVNHGKYDVPGGRITPGESLEDALIREVQEETGLAVYIGNIFFANEIRINRHGEQWQIIRMFFTCTAGGDDVKLSTDHDEYKWIDPKDFAEFELIDNIKPAFEAYNETH